MVNTTAYFVWSASVLKFVYKSSDTADSSFGLVWAFPTYYKHNCTEAYLECSKTSEMENSITRSNILNGK